MSHDIQHLADYLSHILQAIERIHRYTDDIDEISFSQNDFHPQFGDHRRSQPDHRTQASRLHRRASRASPFFRL